MKERPILFSAPMVRAVLDDSKTKTRRLLKTEPIYDGRFAGGWKLTGKSGREAALCSPMIGELCPYGKPGDRLWVREAWTTHKFLDAIPPRDLQTISIAYVADGKIETGKYRQAFHMPRRYSRILLEVTSVSVERLQDISEADAIAEGIERGEGFPGWYRAELPGDSPELQLLGRDFKIPTAFPKLAYRALWESINGPGSWDANPWVWVVGFKRIKEG